MLFFFGANQLVDESLLFTNNANFNRVILTKSSNKTGSILINLSMKLKTPTRGNFSRSGKLCDQTFYHDS